MSLMRGTLRQQPITAARAEAARRMRQLGFSLPLIGMYLCKHHTSIFHYLRLRSPEPQPEAILVPDESGIWAI